MTPYILVFFINVYGGYVPHSIEFLSKQRCEEARKVLLKDGWANNRFAYCVEK